MEAVYRDGRMVFERPDGVTYEGGVLLARQRPGRVFESDAAIREWLDISDLGELMRSGASHPSYLSLAGCNEASCTGSRENPRTGSLGWRPGARARSSSCAQGVRFFGWTRRWAAARWPSV
jgi:hypothetical protein